MKTLFKRLTRDFVDLFMLIAFGGLTIKSAIIGNELALIIGLFFCFYIVTTTWRMGDSAYKLNEYVDDNAYRAMIGLCRYEFRNRPLKRNWKEWFFLFIGIAMLVLYLILS